MYKIFYNFQINIQHHQKKDLKVFTKEAIERFLDKFSTSKQVKKLDPLQHSKKISFKLDDDLDDIKPFKLPNNLDNLIFLDDIAPSYNLPAV